jgi:hypothetical protein
LLLLAVLLSGCNVGGSASDPVTAEQMAAVHADLKNRAFPEHFGPSLGVTTTGCAEYRLGAERSKGRTELYLRFFCSRWPTPCAGDTEASQGESGPAVAALRGSTVENWKFPRDGDLYSEDIKAWFPRRLRRAAAFPGNKVVDAMERQAREDAGCAS